MLTERLQATTATDLESFAMHANRSTIKTPDVLLLARRNEGLESILKDTIERIKEKNEQEHRNNASSKGK